MEYKQYQFNPRPFTMTEQQYIKLIDIIESANPKHIIELGAGESTKIFSQYTNKHDGVVFHSIEHDSQYAGEYTIILPLIDKSTNININGHRYNSCNKYDGFESWLTKQDKYDLILIDGPFGFGERELYTYSRIQLLSFILLDKINDNAYILYHDSERNNAKTTLAEFERLLSEKNITYTKENIGDVPQLTVYKLN